ncbi:hypothetical protein [Cryobacterium sp. Y11]|uniref:hypothetical protein n=1 Tax=Cryobacterium sp. Y11 TaxID=2045016 RepID=UPI0011AFE214|nr:hypothetical protein [Cryobacterium sp. Y11]
MMMHAGSERLQKRVLRPRERIVPHAIIGALALFIPLFAVLYWLSIPRQTWPFVLEAQSGLTTVGAIFVVGVNKMTLKVNTDGLSIRGLLGHRTRLATSTIGSLLLVDLYQSSTVEYLPHLYVLDSDDDVLLHLSGHLWSRSALESVIDGLGIAALRLPDPLTAVELDQLRPQLRHRLVRRAAQLTG